MWTVSWTSFWALVGVWVVYRFSYRTHTHSHACQPREYGICSVWSPVLWWISASHTNLRMLTAVFYMEKWYSATSFYFKRESISLQFLNTVHDPFSIFFFLIKMISSFLWKCLALYHFKSIVLFQMFWLINRTQNKILTVSKRHKCRLKISHWPMEMKAHSTPMSLLVSIFVIFCVCGNYFFQIFLNFLYRIF